MTFVCCNAVFSEILGVSEVDFGSILLSLSVVKGAKRALSSEISIPFSVKLYLYQITVENGEEPTYIGCLRTFSWRLNVGCDFEAIRE